MPDAEEAGELTLEVVYTDEHLIELQAKVTSRGWAGRATAYTVPHDILTFADDLARFLDTLSGEASFVAGEDDGYGLVAIRFYVIDRARHIACHVRLASKTAERPEAIFRVAVELKTQTAAGLCFLHGLRTMAQNQNGRAVLTGE